MGIYFFLIRMAALFGHRKAKLLVEGQANTLNLLRQEGAERWRNAIWFHAASVGEFEQARPIIEELRLKNEECKMILTFFSPSGFEMRKNYDKVDGVFYLPFATHRNAVSFLTALQPKMAIFIKYEFWPAYLKELKRRAIPTYSVSAIFRESQLFFKPWGGAYRSLLHCFTKLFVQDEASKALLNKFQIDEVEVTGDTRFDRVAQVAAQAKEIALVQQFSRVESESESESGKCRVLMAGSTWPEDEELLARYVEEHEDVKLVLVPHEIDEEHLHRIFQIFQGEFVRYTQATPMNLQHTRVLVIDTMGLLSSLYRYADVAYIGGGFGVGIHNTLEAAVYGIPVLFGPNYQRFREAVGLIAAGASRSVSNYDELRDGLDNAFANQAQMGAKAKAFVENGCGATQSILRSLRLKNEN